MSEWIDIGMDISEDVPLWPESPGYQHQWLQRISGESFANVSQLTMELHTATHVDAPLHFVSGGRSVDALSMGKCIGTCQVVEVYETNRISAEDLEDAGIEPNTRRLLLKTDNSRFERLEQKKFYKDFTALSEDAALWLVNQGVELVGIDYLSIQKFEDGPEVHQILLQQEVVIVETLNLRHVEPGRYELLCLPLKIVGAEAAPARVLIKK